MERTDDESNKQPVILPPMIRIAYCTPSLHIPGGVERVLTTKANYLAENGNYDIYILLTDGKGKPSLLYFIAQSKNHPTGYRF